MSDRRLVASDRMANSAHRRFLRRWRQGTADRTESPRRCDRDRKCPQPDANIVGHPTLEVTQHALGGPDHIDVATDEGASETELVRGPDDSPQCSDRVDPNSTVSVGSEGAAVPHLEPDRDHTSEQREQHRFDDGTRCLRRLVRGLTTGVTAVGRVDGSRMPISRVPIDSDLTGHESNPFPRVGHECRHARLRLKHAIVDGGRGKRPRTPLHEPGTSDT